MPVEATPDVPGARIRVDELLNCASRLEVGMGELPRRKPGPERRYGTRLMFSTTDEQRQRLEELAESQETTVAQLVRRAVKDMLEREKASA